MNLKNLLIGFLVILLLTYFSASFLYDPKWVIFVKPFIIPTFFSIIYFYSKLPISKNYLYFILFFYLSELSLLFMDNYSFLYHIGLLFSFISYLFLISLSYIYIKALDLLYEIKPYELFVFTLTIGVLIYLLNLIFEVEQDMLIFIMVILNSISAISLIVVAFLFIKEVFNKKSGYYFFGVMTIFFSDLMSAFNVYFLDDFMLNLMERFLHFLGFYLIYLFFIKKNIKNKSVNLFYEI